MKILLDTNAYVAFKRNILEVVEMITKAETTGNPDPNQRYLDCSANNGTRS